MKAIQHNGQILQGIPPVWNNTFNYRSADQSVWFNDGWRDIITPTVTDIQRLGSIFFDNVNDVFTYPVIDLTEAEIQARVASQAEGARQEALNQKLLAQADESFQAIDTDGEALENQSAFPLWSSFDDQHPFPAQFRVQDFVGTDLILFKIIQPHAKQDDRRPNATPALWTKIEFSGGIEVWSQPTGGDGKYPYLDPSTGNPYRVTHNGRLWVNNLVAPSLNVWEPGAEGITQWTDLGVYP